ncbi:MAG: glycine cleavage system protein GcvH [Cytophagales bacterium]|nr:glycine cleavage system protein GcvH [Cytophagales bacterium]
MRYPKGLLYTQTHEWVRLEDEIATIGISSFAQGELGDIVFVEIDTEGKSLAKAEVFGTIEAVKTVTDIYLPISGKVLEVNSKVQHHPELVNSSPYEEGWLIRLRISDPEELKSLLSAQQYQDILKNS